MPDSVRWFMRLSVVMFAAFSASTFATEILPSPAESIAPAAETAPADDGLPAEPAAVTGSVIALSHALDAEIERSMGYVNELDTFIAELHAVRKALQTQLETTRARVAELAAELQVQDAGTPAVSVTYDRISLELAQVRPVLSDALELAWGPVAAPGFKPGFDPAGFDVPAVAVRLRRLRELRLDIDSRKDTLVSDEETLRWEAVEGWGSVSERLNTLRNTAIENLPPERRRKVLGISAEGVELFRQELEQLGLSARLFRARQLSNFDQVPSRLLDVFAVGSFTLAAFKTLTAVWLFLFLRRRGPRIRRAAHKFVAQSLATVNDRRRGEILVALLVVVVPWSLFLAFVELLRWALGTLPVISALDLPFRVATLYGVYRLTVDTLFAITLRVARRYRLALDEQRTARVLHSVRSLMRVGVGIVMLLTLSERFAGRGYVYHVVLRFSWTFVLGTALLILAGWREVISDAYLDLGKDGRLSSLVRHSRERWYGVFVSGAAFVLLAGRATLLVARDFALGFDQTRRALAFMFRRRAEKRAKERGYAEFDITELPSTVVDTFADRPVGDGSQVLEHFPGLDRLTAMIGPWLADEVGASFLLTGEKGMGKTSWLRQIDGGDISIEHVTLTQRVLTEARLMGFLIKELNLPIEKTSGRIAVHKALQNGPKRIITVDQCQNLFLSKVGGYDTFEMFVSLIEATCGQVFWVCSMSLFAWDHLFSVRPDLMVFRDRETLKAWTEGQIGEMLQKRTAATGVEVVYDDLMLETIRTPDASRLLEIAQQYTRLLWDSSDGNPRAALQYWLRSLVPDSETRLRVRLFRVPTSTDLDPLGERSRFLLAALVVHENLSLPEAEIVTRYPKAVCRLHLERLLDGGILQRTSGRYRLTPLWHRTVIRFLKRGNLLSD